VSSHFTFEDITWRTYNFVVVLLLLLLVEHEYMNFSSSANEDWNVQSPNKERTNKPIIDFSFLLLLHSKEEREWILKPHLGPLHQNLNRFLKKWWFPLKNFVCFMRKIEDGVLLVNARNTPPFIYLPLFFSKTFSITNCALSP